MKGIASFEKHIFDDQYSLDLAKHWKDREIFMYQLGSMKIEERCIKKMRSILAKYHVVALQLHKEK